MPAMSRLSCSLRFILFWLVPYAAIAAAIWGVGGDSKSSAKDFWYWGPGVRWALFFALTSCWVTAKAVTYAFSQSELAAGGKPAGERDVRGTAPLDSGDG